MIAINSIPVNGTFKLKRPLITTQGFVTDPDPVAKNLLDELNTLLGKKIFTPTEEFEFNFQPGNNKDKTFLSESDPGIYSHNNGSNLMEIMRLPLLKKQPGFKTHKDKSPWPDNSLLHRMYSETESESNLSLSDYIDKTGDLASLKYEYLNYVSARWNLLDFNAKTILAYENISNYFIVYGFFIREIEDVNGLMNFVLGNMDGIKKVVNYTIVSSALEYVSVEKINVPHDHNDPFMKSLLAANLSLGDSFKNNIDVLINQQIHSGNEIELIKNAGIGTIPQELISKLVRYIKNSPVPINSSNIKYFLPLFINQLRSAEPTLDQVTDEDISTQENDFEIERFIDDKSTVQITKSNVECAAQLFYSMTLGDELDIFNVVNFFTHKYMVRGNIQIVDNQLREDLQQYVFSNKFTDQKTKRILDRTRQPERQMFYRQVFGYGNVQVTDDVVVNKDFLKLWRILVTESAKYLERAQDSPNPDTYVSRQTVMQAVEDIQYNLSCSCTGMATVITPLIYKELSFVIKRIFMHPELMRQIVPAGGSWWKVIENLSTEMKQIKPRTTVLNNKANLGYDILESIAQYNPSTFENDSHFSAFISNMDAYIITQAQLQEDEDEKRKNVHGQTHPDKTDEDVNQTPGNQPGKDSDKGGTGDWDF